MLVATPPCQGMSKNGIGTIKKAIREGNIQLASEYTKMIAQLTAPAPQETNEEDVPEEVQEEVVDETLDADDIEL